MQTPRPPRLFLCAAALLVAVAFPTRGQTETNLLALGAGALAVVEPSTFGGWPVVALLDDAPGSGWAGVEGEVRGQLFVFELAAVGTIERFEFDTSCIDGDGRAAKGVRLSVSTTARDSGFTPVAETELAERRDGQTIALKARVPARWVRLEIVGNHGDSAWVELCSLRGYGGRTTAEKLPDVSGTYETDYGDFHVLAQGAALRGCYEYDGGLLTGSVDGRVMRITWQENGGAEDNGPAVMTFARDGGSFRGFWWHHTDENAPVAGQWNGKRKSKTVGSCPHWSGSIGGEVERALVAEGRARLYGIEFDLDSATLRPESTPVLDEVVRVVTAHLDWRLAIEGHTDGSGTAVHNQELSERRARAVADYLVAHGAATKGLSSAGFGASRPVGDNATELGRARNRRVEIVRQP